MFTGLTQAIGTVENIKDAGEGYRVRIKASTFFDDDELGDSINVSGACLTIESLRDDGTAEFFLSEETLERTWFDQLEEGDQLNLEKALTPRDRMGGHMVQGHIEGCSTIEEVEELEEGWNMTFSLPEGLGKYIVEKGFVAVEGISLTVTQVSETGFSVTVIPETWKETNLSEKKEGDSVNVETDVMARYAEEMLEGR
ncbi:MAG: riboflavin synthase [Candidatus Nanohalobium sp.]